MRFSQYIAGEFAKFILENYYNPNTQTTSMYSPRTFVGEFIAAKWTDLSEAFTAQLVNVPLKKDKVTSAQRFIATLFAFKALDVQKLDAQKPAIQKETLRKFIESELKNKKEASESIANHYVNAELEYINKMNSDEPLTFFEVDFVRFIHTFFLQELAKIKKIEKDHQTKDVQANQAAKAEINKEEREGLFEDGKIYLLQNKPLNPSKGPKNKIPERPKP